MGHTLSPVRRILVCPITRCVATLLITLGTLPAWAGGVAIVNTVLSDDGDGDGFADTLETVHLRLTIRNTSSSDMTGLTLRLVPHDGALACLSTPQIAVGDLAAGETRLTDPFVLTVADVDRAALGLSATDDLSITFDVLASMSSPSSEVLPAKLTLDLDLDAAGGGAPAEFFESFEGTLGPFENENLDQGKASLAASDGYRCQYNDPDWPGSNTYDTILAESCFLAGSPLHADAVFWDLSGPETSPLGGRGFTGFHSLFFGVELGPPENWTTPVSTLDAVRTGQPIHLGWDNVSPELSMKHQVSFADVRCLTGLPSGFNTDRGVVMVQLADASGAPVGPWIKLDPYQNGYDQQNYYGFAVCTFDPIDDGNTEDDFFYPTNPQYGPSSTCYPEKTFANVGESSNNFAAENIGRADGPGLAGQWGIGTWVESKFDLSRFRGHNIRLRFLVSSIRQTNELENPGTWEDVYDFNPIVCDDGWWIDDVRVTGAVTSAAALVVDAKDNGGLPGPPGGDVDGDGQANVCDNCSVLANSNQVDQDHDDLGDVCDACPTDPTNFDLDGDLVCGIWDNCPLIANPGQADGDQDGSGSVCDCNDADEFVHPGAKESNDGKDNQCNGSIDETSTASFFASKTKYQWPFQPGATLYQAARARSATFDLGCIAFPLTINPWVNDTATPLPGAVLYYLNRAREPNEGSWGQNSAGQEIVVPCAH